MVSYTKCCRDFVCSRGAAERRSCHWRWKVRSAQLPRGSFFAWPHSIGLAFRAAIPFAQYEKLTDAQLTKLVAEQITLALAKTREELAGSSQYPVFQRPKGENSLLAGRVERVWAVETGM